jgi:hypothetical protein
MRQLIRLTLDWKQYLKGNVTSIFFYNNLTNLYLMHKVKIIIKNWRSVTKPKTMYKGVRMDSLD